MRDNSAFIRRANVQRDHVKPWKFDEAKRMRKNPTPAESVLWDRLRSTQLGVRFKRQAVILGYIVDFWCPAWRVAVEADGGYHDDQAEYDAHRDNALSGIGIRVLRFPNERIVSDTDSVISEITNAGR